VSRDDFIFENLAYTRFGDEAFWATVFDSIFDEDHNGKIDFQELILGLSLFHHSTDSDDKLSWIFNSIDVNKDGFLSLVEVERIVLFISKLNKRSSLPPLLINSDELFGILDRDKDGKVSLKEFKAGIGKNPMLAKHLDISFVLQNSLEHVASSPGTPVMSHKPIQLS